MRLDALTSCAELTNEHADQAVKSAESFRAFLTWAAGIARPGEGAPKVLMAVARLTRTGWVDGAPYVEIRGDDESTTLSIFADHGMGIRERMVPLTRLHVPLEEFSRALRLAPQLIAPFRSTQRGDALILTPPGEEEPPKSSRESIRIDERSLHVQERKTVPGFESPVGPSKTAPDSEAAPPTVPELPGLHTHPTVRRMVAVRPEALRTGKDDD
jgi:hypothetical protein